jgi:hypothetical protein
MKLFSFNNQFVADLATHNQNNDFIAFDIIQCAKISGPKLELGQRIRAKSLNGFRRLVGLVLEA